MKMLKVKEVIYSNDDNTFTNEKIKEINTTHVSSYKRHINRLK